MADVLLQQVTNMTQPIQPRTSRPTFSSSSDTQSSSIFTRLFASGKPRLNGMNSNIYAHMCSQLEPERDYREEVASYNATEDVEARYQKWRRDSAVSTQTTSSVENVVIEVAAAVEEKPIPESKVMQTVQMPSQRLFENVPKWSWPESVVPRNRATTIS